MSTRYEVAVKYSYMSARSHLDLANYQTYQQAQVDDQNDCSITSKMRDIKKRLFLGLNLCLKILGLTHWVDVVRAKPAPHLPQV